MRKVSKKDHITRQWEKGFLSADCGDFGKEDIGLPLYKPDIEGREDAICDYYFNETVIMYSHDNIRNFGTMVVDYLNVWAMLWVAGVSQEARDITFFNVDSIRKGKYFADSTNQFFR